MVMEEKTSYSFDFRKVESKCIVPLNKQSMFKEEVTVEIKVIYQKKVEKDI